MNKNNCVVRKDIRLTKKEATKARLHGFVSREALAQVGDPIIKDVPYGMAHRMNAYCKMEVNLYDDEWAYIDYGDTDNLYKAYTAVKPVKEDEKIELNDGINIGESISIAESHEEETVDEPIVEEEEPEELEASEDEEEEEISEEETEVLEEENTVPPLASTLIPATNAVDTEAALHTVEEVATPNQNNNSNKYYNNYKKKRR